MMNYDRRHIEAIKPKKVNGTKTPVLGYLILLLHLLVVIFILRLL